MFQLFYKGDDPLATSYIRMVRIMAQHHPARDGLVMRSGSAPQAESSTTCVMNEVTMLAGSLSTVALICLSSLVPGGQTKWAGMGGAGESRVNTVVTLTGHTRI